MEEAVVIKREPCTCTNNGKRCSACRAWEQQHARPEEAPGQALGGCVARLHAAQAQLPQEQDVLEDIRRQLTHRSELDAVARRRMEEAHRRQKIKVARVKAIITHYQAQEAALRDMHEVQKDMADGWQG